MKKPCIILTGPTAVGKTSLSIALARKVGGEIISADSMQVYKYMDIGSAKITKQEMQDIPHFLIDELLPDEEFHVVKFKELAQKYMSQIYERGHIPILVGGTGFYIQAVLYDIDFSEGDNNSKLREQLQQFVADNGAAALHERLREVDPCSADAIHANNVKRVIRAIEFFTLTGNKISEHNEQQRQRSSPYQFAYFVLEDERAKLYARINQRVDKMLKDGLLDEVKKLQTMGYTRDMVSMQGLGYKELLDYLDAKITYEEAVYRIKRDTRHFAKRQLTWFAREREVCTVYKPDFHDEEAILSYMMEQLKKKEILV